MKRLQNRKGFLSLLGLLLAIGIMAYLCYLMINTYFKKSGVDEQTNQPISASNYRNVLDSTKGEMKKIETRVLDRENELFKNLP